MSNFKTKWVCQDCGEEVWALFGQDPDDFGCNCEEDCHEKCEPVKRFDWSNISDSEKKARYRIAYYERGGTWEGVKPYIYKGDLEEGELIVQEFKRKLYENR